MQIKIAKDWREYISPVTKKRLDCAIRFGVKYFNLEKHDKTIYIKFVDVIDGKDNVITLGKYRNIPYGDYDVLTVATANRHWIQMAVTIFHELTHAKQFMSRELRFYATGVVVFKDSLVPNDVEYWDLPYEVEARQYQKTLTRRWLWYRLKMWLTKG